MGSWSDKTQGERKPDKINVYHEHIIPGNLMGVMVRQYYIKQNTATEKKLHAYEEETLLTRIHTKRNQFDNLLIQHPNTHT